MSYLLRHELKKASKIVGVGLATYFALMACRNDHVLDKTRAGLESTVNEWFKPSPPAVHRYPNARVREPLREIVDEEYRLHHMPSSISKELVFSIIRQESGGNPNVVGSYGERGLMQLTHDTWNRMSNAGWDEAFDPRTNVCAGLNYLTTCFNYLSASEDWERIGEREKLRRIIAAYTMGEAGPARYGYSLSRYPSQKRSYVHSVESRLYAQR